MVSEFEFVENIKSKYALDRIGDDCAVMPKDAETDLLLTADMLVEDIDFRLDWTTPEFLGHKALAVSLSDIAAMVGTPVWSMLSLCVPEKIWNTDFLDRFYEGWFSLAKHFDIELVGGDVSQTPDKLVIDSIVGGEVPKGQAILRSGAKLGDAIFITGKLGGAAGGLILLENGVRFDDSLPKTEKNLLLRQLQPTPQVVTANLLQTNGKATAAIDISDGLSSDLMHLCMASKVGAKIDAGWLPIDPSLAAYFPADRCLELALHGGEDFELLFTLDVRNIVGLDMSEVTRIGTVTANERVIEFTDGNTITILEPKGYSHF